MENKIIENLLMQNGWIIEKEIDKLEIYKNIENTNMRNPEQTYFCTNDGIYYYSRGQICEFGNYGDFEKNLLGLYLYITRMDINLQNLIQKEMEQIKLYTDYENINKIFSENFSELFLRSKLNQNINGPGNKKFNIKIKNNIFFIIYNYGENNEIIIESSAQKDEIYPKLFKILKYTEEYDNILNNLNDINLDDELYIRLFLTYYKKSYLAPVEDKKKVR